MNIHRQRFQSGLQLVNEGKRAESLAKLQEAFAHALADREPRWISMIGRNLALLYEKSGQLEKAIECLQTVVQQIPDDAIALHALGETYLLTGDQPKAERAFDACRRIAEREGNLHLLELLDVGRNRRGGCS